MTTLRLKHSINRSPSRLAFLLIPLMLVCFGLSPIAQAVTPELLTALPDEAVVGFNTRDGLNAMTSLTTGTFNTGIGFAALESDNSGSHNTALGAQALLSNTTGNFNTAIGENAMVFNQDGVQNMALGQGALANNVSGSNNTAMGFQALNANTTNFNTAVGFQALLNNDTGGSNTAIGAGALNNNTTGTGNIALGSAAGNVIHTGSGNIEIGNSGVTVNEHDTIRIGFLQTQTFIAGIHGVTTGGVAIPVLVDSIGQLGTMSSSRRFKDDIKPMAQASEAILGLKPVTFHYKSDKKDTPQFGLIAEEVAQVNPDLIVRDDKGEIYTVRYDAVNAMLLNEFLKEHSRTEKLEATVAQQEKQIKALASGLQRVSDQLELAKPAQRTVVNNQ